MLIRNQLGLIALATAALAIAACSGSSFEGTSGSAGSNATGGSSSSAGSTQSGGSTSAGSSAGGTSSAGTNAGGTSSGGTSSGGTSSAGASGSAGSGGKPDCSALLSAANDALDKAETCDPMAKVDECTGSARGICGCTVPTQADDSAATKAYLGALQAVQDNQCVQACPAIACIAPGPGACQAQSGSGPGRCVSRPVTTQ